MNGHELKGKKLIVEISQSKEQRQDNVVKFTNLFVRNLPTGTTEKNLNDLFATFGNINSCRIKTTKDGQPKNEGVVLFESFESALKAKEDMNKFDY